MTFKKKKGISLLEIIMAVVFFGIIAVALSLPVSNSLYLNVDNKNINTANSLAKSYIRELKDNWQLVNDFEQGNLIAIDNTYTNNGAYTVTVNSTDLETDSEGDLLVRRVNIVYQDSDNNILCDFYYDYNRPGNI